MKINIRTQIVKEYTQLHNLQLIKTYQNLSKEQIAVRFFKTMMNKLSKIIKRNKKIIIKIISLMIQSQKKIFLINRAKQ